MKIYFLGTGIVSLVIVLFGFVFPTLFSSSSTEAVLLGCVGIIVSIPTLVIMCRLFIKLISIKKEMK